MTPAGQRPNPRLSVRRLSRPAVGLFVLLAAACESPVAPGLAVALSPPSVQFRAVRGSSILLTQTIQVSNTGGGRLGPVSCPEVPAPWLACAVTDGTVVTLTANPTSVTTGRAQATVPLTAAGVSGETAIAVELVIEDPVLALSASTVAFTADEGSGATNPGSALVTVTNEGAGTLANLGGISCVPTPPNATVSCSVDQGTGVLSIRVDHSGVAPGTHVFPLAVSAPNSSVTQTLAVTLAVSARPRIVLSESSVHFASTRGATIPLSRTVTVTNSGSGSLGTISCPNRPALWLTCSVSGSTITLTGNPAGLTSSPSPATVAISATGAQNSPAPISVSFTIEQPLLSLSADALTFEGEVAGRSSGAEQTVQVSNTGAGTRADLGTISCTPPTGSPLTCVVSASTGQLTVRVNATNLTPGVRSYPVAVRAANSGIARTLSVTVEVDSPPTIALSRSSLQFEAVRGTTSLISQSVTVTNTGGGALGDVECPAINVTWLTCSEDEDDEDAGEDVTVLTFFANPSGRTNSPSPITVEITATGLPNREAELLVSLNILQPILTLSTSRVDFTAALGGNTTTPGSRDVLVTNSGAGSLSSLGTISCSVEAGVICQNLGGGVLRVMVDPTGRSAGTHVFFVTVSAPNMSNSPQTLVIVLTVS